MAFKGPFNSNYDDSMTRILWSLHLLVGAQMQDVQMECTHSDGLVGARSDHPLEFSRWLQIG